MYNFQLDLYGENILHKLNPFATYAVGLRVRIIVIRDVD